MLTRLLRDKKGQALVEFALVIPLLLALFLGIVEFGRIFSADLIVANVAREGARLGAVGGTDSEIVDRIENAAVNLDPALLDVTITPVQADRIRGQQINICVKYPVAVAAPFIAVFTGNTVTVESTSIMRVE